jgi:hypothetical protein
MAQITLRTVTKGADRFVVVRRDGNSWVTVSNLTEKEYADLASGFAPRGIDEKEWASGGVQAWRVPDYGGSTKLASGEVAEISDRFEIGVQRRDGRLVRVEIPKGKVTVSREGGLTLTKSAADAWRDDLITSISNGVMTTPESLSGRRN